MRKLSLLGGAAATLLGATVVMAASPAPSTAPAATPAPTVAPQTTAPTVSTPKTTIPKAAAPAAATAFSASVQPLVLEGTATFVRAANGTATLTMKMQGLAPNQPWQVTVVPGRLGTFGTRTVLFRWTAGDIDRLGADTLRVHLTAAEYRSIARARTATGFLILVSDGANQSVATFAKS